MFVSRLIALSDAQGLTPPTFDPAIEFRHNVVPLFLRALRAAVGRPPWMVKHYSISSTSARVHTLPTDFGRFIRFVCVSPGAGYYPLTDITDDPDCRLAAQLATTPSTPSSYYIESDRAIADPSTPLSLKLTLGAPPDGSYTYVGQYEIRIPFPDDTTDIDLDAYIPSDTQWGLVLLYRREVVSERLTSHKDPRYSLADQRWQEWLMSLQQEKRTSAAPSPRRITV